MVEAQDNVLRYLGCGVIATDSEASLPARLCTLHTELARLIAEWRPEEAAVEQTYVTRNGASTLKLGYARGIALLTPAEAGVKVAEYGAMEIKRAVVGTGSADKKQVEMMVRRLLPGAVIKRADASDALAMAICHAHHRESRIAWAAGVRMA